MVNMTERKVRVGIIGLGARGLSILEDILLPMYDRGLIDILGVCDLYEDRREAAARIITEKTGRRPVCSADYKDILAIDGAEAILILSAWESHLEIAMEAMRAGKHVGLEVGGAFSADDCFRLVKTFEETGKHCMLLENCCFGRWELMVLNMVKQGFFGEIVHCSGGYMHDLRDEIVNGDVNHHYRRRNYICRNCENYPTHELGPIAKVLDINHGNRMLYLTSVASGSRGLHQYILDKKGPSHPDAGIAFAQSDIVTTVIKCARGQTIVLTLDTTLPRMYSRGFTVRGTKGMYCEDGNYIHMDGEPEFDTVADRLGNAEKYAKTFEHPLWVEYKKDPIGGHDGMDWLVFTAFIESVRENTPPPIDTYDTASWMSISCLSEESVARGGAPVAIPDFTNGKWIRE